jgi:hypothetical protein
MKSIKTPEEMAEEYANDLAEDFDRLFPEDAAQPFIETFLAGHKAAQEHAHAALEEAEAKIRELRDQLMEESGGRLKLFKDDADAKAAYQEALEETKLEQAKWITAKQKKELCGIFKHEDEIWPDGYVQLWIPNDINRYAIVLGRKGQDRDGKSVLIAGFRNPFGPDQKPLMLPGDEYKHWCETPRFTEEMEKRRNEVLAEQDKGNPMYPYQQEEK